MISVKDEQRLIEEKSVRPTLLEALCLLSFIGSSAGVLLYLAAALYFGEAIKQITEFSSFDNMESLSPLYFFLTGGFHLLSFTGVYRMWHFRQSGFFIYTLAQVALFFLPLLWLGKEAFSSTALVFTILFITGYAFSFGNLQGQSLENSRTLSR